ncbi:MAG TPA: aromatic-ring-hydroxylating dioxygenase subunit beta [Burkholderiales bacterium]|jgi:3-phenylpropionate/cinnamic acid dioxygenase small subunit|nr:aromatic-ring-hydroxylating dioxygenase subunit beta [Burkholderiales bacterium]
MYPGYEMAPPDPRTTRELRLEIEEFHAAYCWTLDCGDVEHWPEYFTEDAVYRITARENADAGLPVGLVYADSRAMIRDRAFALKHTQMYAPRTLQHLVTNVRVLQAKGDAIKAQSNYLLLQTLVDGPTTIQQSGRYYDTFVRKGGKLLLKERQCIYDTVLIANDLVLPV